MKHAQKDTFTLKLSKLPSLPFKTAIQYQLNPCVLLTLVFLPHCIFVICLVLIAISDSLCPCEIFSFISVGISCYSWSTCK